jgi:hypothetical protein
MKKNCLECGLSFVGRSDKKFCSNYCRNTYNNKINPACRNLIRNTNNRLKRNHKILEKLNANGKTTVSKQTLHDAGFDFQTLTSLSTTNEGNTCFYVYNQGYSCLEKNHYLLIDKNASS